MCLFILTNKQYTKGSNFRIASVVTNILRPKSMETDVIFHVMLYNIDSVAKGEEFIKIVFLLHLKMSDSKRDQSSNIRFLVKHEAANRDLPNVTRSSW